MKLFVPFFMLFFSIHLSAQSVILFEQDSVSEVFESQDISDNTGNFALDLFFENNTDEAISVNWRRELSENCPVEWEVITADQLYTYVPGVNESQLPLEMIATDSHFIIRQLFWPNDVAGCCDMKVIFSLDGAPESPIDTGYYHVEINSTCFATSVFDEELEELNIYPNPASSIIYIENSHSIEAIEIVDLTGKLCYQIKESNVTEIDISFLPKGLYYLKVKTASGGVGIRKVVRE
jgi:hypothetical protein